MTECYNSCAVSRCKVLRCAVSGCKVCCEVCCNDKFVQLESCPTRVKLQKNTIERVSTIIPRTQDFLDNVQNQNNQFVGEEFSILKFMRRLNSTESTNNNTYESTKCIIAIICLFCIV